jgi:hypothetical protein
LLSVPHAEQVILPLSVTRHDLDAYPAGARAT